MVRPVSVTLVPVVVAASVPPLVYTSYEATGYVPGVEAVQLSVAVPDVLLDVLEDKPETVGVAYMLKGDKGASNTDPYATKPTADNQWVVSGPHIMLLPTDASQLDTYPTDWTKGGPWVMWKGTPYAHIMVPTTSMAKSASKAPAEKKADNKK